MSYVIPKEEVDDDDDGGEIFGGAACPAISDIHRHLYIENSCKLFDCFQT